MKNVVLLFSLSLLFVACQARPKSDKTVQIRANEKAAAETLSLTPVELLASERALQSVALLKVLLEHVTESSISKLADCDTWNDEPQLGLLQFSRCRKDNIIFSGKLETNRSADGNLDTLSFDLDIVELLKAGSPTVATSTKLSIDLPKLSLKSSQNDVRIFESALKITEQGNDMNSLARVGDIDGEKIFLQFTGKKLTGIRLGTLAVKLKRAKKKIDKALWLSAPSFISYDTKFWKGSLQAAESNTSTAAHKEVAFAEGAISLPQPKGSTAPQEPDLSVQCTTDKAEGKNDVEKKSFLIRCLLAGLHTTGPGR